MPIRSPEPVAADPGDHRHDLASSAPASQPAGDRRGDHAGIALGRCDTDVQSARKLVNWGWGLLISRRHDHHLLIIYCRVGRHVRLR
jgi:hypothetical protein